MNSESGAGLLHRLTSYSPDRDWDVPADDPRVRHDLVPNDPETLPPPVKSYPEGLPVVALSRDLRPGPPAGQVLSGTAAPARSLDAVELGRVLFMRGIDIPHWVVVHAVDDVEPGVYRWPALDQPVRTGSLRDELMRLALGQGLAADAAYVVIGAVPSDLLDDRSYRTAQLAAGVVEGRLHLAAYATGATATGMTFLDSDVPALLGEGPDLVTLLWTCVGVGEYRSTPGGGPGAPVAVRPIASRLAED